MAIGCTTLHSPQHIHFKLSIGECTMNSYKYIHKTSPNSRNDFRIYDFAWRYFTAYTHSFSPTQNALNPNAHTHTSQRKTTNKAANSRRNRQYTAVNINGKVYRREAVFLWLFPNVSLRTVQYRCKNWFELHQNQSISVTPYARSGCARILHSIATHLFDSCTLAPFSRIFLIFVHQTKMIFRWFILWARCLEFFIICSYF